MARLAHHPAYLQIEDQLDVLGQKYRVQRIVRGSMLWGASAILATFAAALAADLLSSANPASYKWVTCLLVAWIVALVAGFLAWFVRPMILRPRSLDVARLVESRVAGLHNGLTNSVLLARRDDLAESPWLPAIFAEVVGEAGSKSLDQAVKFSDLRPLAIRLACAIVPIVAVACIPAVSHRLGHGWQQLFSPTAFVPKTGSVAAVEVQPGDITLIAGQPLEVTVTARGANLDARDDTQSTLLMDFARQGKAGPVQWLLAHGADRNARNKSGKTPAEIGRKHAGIVRLLQGSAAEPARCT